MVFASETYGNERLRSMSRILGVSVDELRHRLFLARMLNQGGDTDILKSSIRDWLANQIRSDGN